MPVLHRGLWMLLLLIAVNAGAQDTVLTAETEELTEDSTTILEEEAYEEYEDYNSEEADVLYFIGKEDSTALYDSTPLAGRMVPDSLVQQLKQDEAFWYVDKDLQQKKRQEKKQQPSNWWQRMLEGLLDFISNPIIRQLLFYGVIFLFVLGVAWFLINNQMNILGRSKQRIRPLRTTDTNEETTIHADLDKALGNAETAGAYRLAIRLRYLQLLKRLSELQLIQYREDATNMEYLTQLYGHSGYPLFFSLTRHYEYAWYGEALVTRDIYNRLSADFVALQKILSNA